VGRKKNKHAEFLVGQEKTVFLLREIVVSVHQPKMRGKKGATATSTRILPAGQYRVLLIANPVMGRKVADPAVAYWWQFIDESSPNCIVGTLNENVARHLMPAEEDASAKREDTPRAHQTSEDNDDLFSEEVAFATGTDG